jgi:diguanylate cyclase (GGDEF)-like protein
VIWSIAGAGAVVASTIYLTFVRSLPAPHQRLPFFLIAALFAVAEVAVAHVEVGSQSYGYSLVEAPLVLGLLYLGPRYLIFAWLLGAAITLGLLRRQAPVKLAYNLTAFALESLTAALVFHAFAHDHGLLDAATFVGVFGATLLAALINIAAVFLAVHLTQGPAPRHEGIQQLAFGVLSTVVTTSATLIGVVLWRFDQPTVLLLAVAGLGVYLAQRTFTGQLREHRRLEFLRQSTELVGGLGTEESITALLGQISQTLHSEVSALVYLPVDVPDSLALVVCGPSGAPGPLELVPREDHWGAWSQLAPGRHPRIISQPRTAARLADLIGRPGLRQAIVVPLCGDLNVIGYLTVADRPSDVRPFSDDDLEVLDTLERLVSMGLENGHLERSLHEARLLERHLVHRATHDALTGLANRTFLADHLARLLDEPDGSDLACLFIDLDDFTAVNDRHGPSIADQLLVVTAQRLVGGLRDGDMAARLGDDRLAVIAHLSPDKDHAMEATALGDRIVVSLARPASIGADTIETGATVGIVLARPGASAADLLAAADDAVSAARTDDPARVTVHTPGRKRARR